MTVLQNSGAVTDVAFHSMHWKGYQDFHLCSHFININYGAWYVYKSLFGSSVASCQLACSKISLSIIKKKLERSFGKGWTYVTNLADGVTALAQLYALHSHRARSFNQWQYALYPNFIIITNIHDKTMRQLLIILIYKNGM